MSDKTVPFPHKRRPPPPPPPPAPPVDPCPRPKRGAEFWRDLGWRFVLEVAYILTICGLLGAAVGAFAAGAVGMFQALTGF